MLGKKAAYTLVALGLALGVLSSHFLTQALASRNSSGTYSLPAGNPVVSGTTITSATHNTTMSDIATAITDSLDRSGRGAMLAPLECTNGTVAAPSITFDSDVDTGLYRVASNDLGATAGGVLAQRWIATGAVFPLVATAEKGIVVTQSTSNASAGTFTGNGSGRGVLGTGGGTNGAGLRGVGGATNGPGVEGAGTGTGAGVTGVGGNSGGGGYGADFTGGGTNGAGVYGLGSGTGGGGVFTGGSTGAGGPGLVVTSGGTRGAIEIGGSDPASTVGFADSITPMNVVKGWGFSQNASVLAGFNVASVSCATNVVTVNWQTDFSSANYACFATYTGASTPGFAMCSALTGGTASVAVYDASGTIVNLCAGGENISFMALGAN